MTSTPSSSVDRERWTVTAEPGDAVDDTVGLAVDVDPRTRTLNLGVRILSGGAPELWYGAVVRRFFEGERADWTSASDWLASEQAAALLAAIEAGYEARQAWTGDWTGHWTPEAAAALDALHRGIAARVVPG